MKMSPFPFELTNWNDIEVTEHKGESGFAYWKTLYFGDIRVRMVEYTAGYLANHWCSKGHVIYCLEGEMVTELKDGRAFTLQPGISYQVGDNSEAHRSWSKHGVKLFIVD
jgi:quercetin dioxygenase-like cupin family protein